MNATHFPISPWFRGLAMATLVSAGAWLQAAAPDNDSYGSATELAAGPAVVATNVDATLETNEPLPPGFTSENYGGSVWWKWTPIFNGWYEINTAGSSIDTVLSIWTGVGDDLTTPKFLVHSNDEAAEGKVSRIQFYADNLTTYRIAVGGHGAGARGAVNLHAFFIPEPFAKVLAVTFVHSSVDVTSSEETVTATLTIEASREIESGKLTILTPDGTARITKALSHASRVSGNVAHGDYQLSFSLPRYLQPGSYRWNVSLANEPLGKVASHGTEALTPLAYGLLPAIAVANTGMVDGYGEWRSSGLARGLDVASLTLDRYAFGMTGDTGVPQPMSATGGALVRTGGPSIGIVTDVGGAKRLQVKYVRRLNAAQQGLEYKVQFSDDLATWEDATEPEQWLGSDGTFEARQVSDNVTSSQSPRRFARVLVDSLVP